VISIAYVTPSFISSDHPCAARIGQKNRDSAKQAEGTDGARHPKTYYSRRCSIRR